MRIGSGWLSTLFLAATAPAFAGTPPFAPERVLRFDATGPDIATETPTDAIAWPAEFTLEAWVYPTAASPYGVIAGRAAADRGSDPYFHVALAFEGADGLRPAIVQSTGQPGTYRNVQATTPLAPGQWVHLAATRDAGGTLALYVDGDQVASGASPGPVAPTPGVPFAVGNSAAAGGGTQCCGSHVAMRNVKLWSRALTAAELQASAAANAYAAVPAGLVRFWRLDDDVGAVFASALPGGSPLLAGDGAHAPAWFPTAFLDPVFEARTATTTARAATNNYLWPIRLGAQTHYVGATMAYPPTVPATESSITLYSPEDGVLVDRSAERLVGDIRVVHPRDVAVADFTGDGREDMFIADHGTDTAPFPGAPSRLLVQQPDGRLADETSARVPIGDRFTHNVASADVDGDGDVDLLLCALGTQPGKRTALLLNDGTGFFSDATSRLPPEVGAGTLNCMSGRFADFDGDDDEDFAFGIWIDGDGNDAAALRGDREILLINDGTGRFTRGPADALPPRAFGRLAETMQMTPGDIDGDGDVDLLVVVTPPGYDGWSVLQLFMNDGTGRFTEDGGAFPQTLAKGQWHFFHHLLDFDGDGRLDVYTDSQGMAPELFLNRGTEWLPVGAASGLSGLVAGKASWPIDFDGDGRLDVAVAGQGVGGVVRARRAFPTNPARAGFALADGVDRRVRLDPGESHERLYFDVPERARAVRFEGTGDPSVDLYLSRVPFSTQPDIAAAPARDAAVASAFDGEAIALGSTVVAPGRWYVTPVNTGQASVDVAVRATLVDAAAGPPVAAGHFYDPQRSGHGISYEYVAGQRVLIWYAYLEDGTPVWYYAQDASASPETGQWTSPLYRFHWNGNGSRPRTVGSVTVTEAGRGTSDVDRVVFSWNLDGRSGSGLMERLGGTGCPAGFAGNNGMWFAPSLSGYGYTVTYFPDYEFVLLYLYDRFDNPRWLGAEAAPFSSTPKELPMYQASGFCPHCAWRAPERTGVGVLTREFANGSLSRLAIDAELLAPVEGSWIQDRPVTLLTDPSPCLVP